MSTALGIRRDFDSNFRALMGDARGSGRQDPAEPAREAPSFRVGQRVRVLDHVSYTVACVAGQFGVIHEVFEFDEVDMAAEYTVRTDAGAVARLYDSEMEFA